MLVNLTWTGIEVWHLQDCINAALAKVSTNTTKGWNKKLTKSKISVITHHHLSIDHIGFDNLKLFCIWNFNESAPTRFQEVQSNTSIISTQFGCPLQRTTVAHCLENYSKVSSLTLQLPQS